MDSTPWIPDSRNWIPAFVSGILDSLGCIPDSKKKRIPGFKDSEIQNPSSRGAIFWVMSHNVELCVP